jgi:hypothetical protein
VSNDDSKKGETTMRLLTVLGLGLVLGSVGCAGQLSAADVAKVSACSAGRAYDGQELAAIQRLRDEGAGLKEVAARVGGTRGDVRCVEVLARARRQGWRAEQAVANGSAMASASWLVSLR